MRAICAYGIASSPQLSVGGAKPNVSPSLPSGPECLEQQVTVHKTAILAIPSHPSSA